MKTWWKEKVAKYARSRVRKIPDPVLKKPAKSGHPGVLAWLREKRLLFVFRHQEDALGLAAPQIGCQRRIFVVLVDADGHELVFHNPIVELLASQEERAYEGCLSIPGGEVEVSRVRWVRINGENAWGRKLPTLDAVGVFAVVLQHEYDHLNGVLITDHGPLLTREERDAAEQEEEKD